MEQAPGGWHHQQVGDRGRPGALAKDGDVARVAAKIGDMALHPLQGADLVLQAKVRRNPGGIEEPKRAHAVFDGRPPPHPRPRPAGRRRCAAGSRCRSRIRRRG